MATSGTRKGAQGAVSVSRETPRLWFHVKRRLSLRPGRQLVERPSMGTGARVIHTKPNPQPSTPQGYPQAISTAGSAALCWRATLPAEARRASGIVPSGRGLVVGTNSQPPSTSSDEAPDVAHKTRPESADFSPHSSIGSRIGAPGLTHCRAWIPRRRDHCMNTKDPSPHLPRRRYTHVSAHRHGRRRSTALIPTVIHRLDVDGFEIRTGISTGDLVRLGGPLATDTAATASAHSWGRPPTGSNLDRPLWPTGLSLIHSV
ncbi:hypothetical protein ACVWWH_002282 [Sinomonas sp. RB5]